MDTIVIATGAVCLVVFLSVWTSKAKLSTRLPLPPGPRRIPFLGNALDINIAEPHVTYMQWKRQYGVSSAANSFTAPTKIDLSLMCRGHHILSAAWTGLHHCELGDSGQSVVRRETLCDICRSSEVVDL